ncbi:MAG: hypothetical protein A2W61_00050 [Deltaproteobacteria bacterium RIFCSPLOWO2_01_44_7]|nr:MAG: hypothetical protein A2712_00910 [Deltaproteobacteria bacterium RIFCSPHIGHO2_01_FULL_43_49]OGQ15300.1 MAG: hypothetical protein A3D22_04565 [Deltaproteobacteria bacterium RIFCSPHIGHO2_02_FULL_44_53]OGQ27076.1 MAG: hypothetical protein A3D98_01500 [Deltaproteobacteria bacterium RIFCSPHIGHO2_12_FULL_44_21]OGQ31816.1 MAG: hypothetical protein A2979_05725 [Deltaproteobacteria bacterium RIFCSPLOWO2_01_FULL_45_74]OGQ37630.1 MAG: hypothetical protein A2W61_00050 [Deltaproteobacteria bacterium 
MISTPQIEIVGTIPNKKEIKNIISKIINECQSLLKFAYLEKGAQAWDTMRQNTDFLVGNREINALKEISAYLNQSIDFDNEPINFIHLGSGNGIEIPVFTAMFKLKKKDTYIGVDISKELLEILRKNYSEYLSKKVTYSLFFQTDLELKGNIKHVCNKISSHHRAINIIAASGEGTLFSNHNVLKYISDALGKSDYAVFSIDGVATNDVQSICLEYDKTTVREFLIHGIKYAKSVGAVKNDFGQFLPTYYDDNLQQIIVSYKLADGDTVILLKSFKPSNEKVVERIFNKNGLEIVHLAKTKDNAFGILCKKGIF